MSESRAVCSVPCARQCELYFFFFQVSFFEFSSRLHCGYFIVTIGNYYFYFVFNVNLWHDFEIKREKQAESFITVFEESTT